MIYPKILLLGLALITSFTAHGARLISTGVGQVGEHVVTSREVQINQAVEGALRGGKNINVTLVTEVDSAKFAKEVTSVLLEWVVFLEAKNVAVAEVTSDEITQAEAEVKRQLSKNSSWKSLKIESRELSQLIRRKLLAKKFIRFRAESSVVPISDSEARKYYEQNRQKFADMPFEKFKSSIKTYLSKEQVEARLKTWFEVLQNKHKVRNFLSEL